MALYAFKDGVTVLNQDNLNALLALQSFQLIYEGVQRAAVAGSGVVENSVANYSYCSRFVLSDSTEIGRIELEIDRDGAGADLIVQIRSGMNPESGVDGTLLKQIVVPKEFIPTTKTYWSVPIGLSGLASGSYYWLVVLKNGDSTNKLDWLGETSQSSSYPSYQRAGASGVWSVRNALHFKVFSGEVGELVHSLYSGTCHTTIIYSGEIISKICRYLPPMGSSEGGIRNVLALNWNGEYIKSGVV